LHGASGNAAIEENGKRMGRARNTATNGSNRGRDHMKPIALPNCSASWHRKLFAPGNPRHPTTFNLGGRVRFLRATEVSARESHDVWGMKRTNTGGRGSV
jgi:hypothetical protein